MLFRVGICVHVLLCFIRDTGAATSEVHVGFVTYHRELHFYNVKVTNCRFSKIRTALLFPRDSMFSILGVTHAATSHGCNGYRGRFCATFGRFSRKTIWVGSSYRQVPPLLHCACQYNLQKYYMPNVNFPFLLNFIIFKSPGTNPKNVRRKSRNGNCSGASHSSGTWRTALVGAVRQTVDLPFVTSGCGSAWQAEESWWPKAPRNR